MLVDLQLAKKKALAVILDAEEASKRLGQLFDARCHKVWLVTSKQTAERIRFKSKLGRLEVVPDKTRLLGVCTKVLSEFEPFLSVISTGSESLDMKIAAIARRSGSLVYVVDSPKLNDLNMPAVARFGDVRVAVSTGGRSPAMASILRKRIEKSIQREDVLQVKLQGRLKKHLKRSSRDPALRKKMVYMLLADKAIQGLLKQDKFERALELGVRQIRKYKEEKLGK